MTRLQARAFVRSSGARFVLASCAPRVNLLKLLGPLIISVHRFGCAAVFDLGLAGKPEGPLADLPTNAAVRAPRRQ
jgi:hypothetical protein